MMYLHVLRYHVLPVYFYGGGFLQEDFAINVHEGEFVYVDILRLLGYLSLSAYKCESYVSVMGPVVGTHHGAACRDALARWNTLFY